MVAYYGRRTIGDGRYVPKKPSSQNEKRLFCAIQKRLEEKIAEILETLTPMQEVHQTLRRGFDLELLKKLEEEKGTLGYNRTEFKINPKEWLFLEDVVYESDLLRVRSYRWKIGKYKKLSALMRTFGVPKV